MNQSALDLLWIIICAALVFIMQAGFLCLESGCTRTKNSINVAVKNLTDFGISLLVFWAFGFALMFGASRDGLLGFSHFFFETSQTDPRHTTFFIFQAMFCGTSVTIVSGAVAERMSFKGYLLIAFFVSAVVYPVFGHWAWGGAFVDSSGWLSRLGFIDFAGSSVVHSIGGWVALAAIIVLGPRLGRYQEDGKPRPIPGQSLPLALLGTLILCFGWIGFNGGSTLMWGEDVPGIVTHTILAGTSGMITALAVGVLLDRYPDVKYPMNGLLAGLVAITANCHVVSAAESVLIGAIGAIVMILTDRVLERFRLDDVVGAFSVHAAAGVWGTLAVAIFGDGLDLWPQLGVQALGVLVCAAVGFLPAFAFLSLARAFVRLRVTEEDELIGLNAAEHKVSTEQLDLLREMELQSRKFDPSRRVYVEPFTEVGQIAKKYNEVLDSLEKTAARNELVIRDTKDGILTCDRDGRILSVNQGAELMFGYTEEALESKSLWNIVSSSSQLEFHTLSELLHYAGGLSYKMDTSKLVGLRASGERFPIEVEISEGEIMGKEIVTLKIRDRSQVEEYQDSLRKAKIEAERARDELSGKVRQIERFNSIAIDREMRMVELKDEINRLCGELGRVAPYRSTQDISSRS